MIAEEVAETGGIGVVVVVVPRLVRVACVKGDALIDIGVAVPDAIAAEGRIGCGIRCIGVRVRERIPVVKHRHAVHEDADDSQTGERFCAGHGGHARDAVKDAAIGRVVGKEIGLGGIQVPRPHGVGTQAGGTNVHPTVGVTDLMDACIGRQRLIALSPAPSRRCIARRLIRHGGEDFRIPTGTLRVPRGDSRVLSLRRRQGERQKEEAKGAGESHEESGWMASLAGWNGRDCEGLTRAL